MSSKLPEPPTEYRKNSAGEPIKYVEYDGYSTDFSSYVDLNTLALQEDYREGHDLYVKSYPVVEAFGST